MFGSVACGRLVSSLIAAFPATKSELDKAMAATVWALVEQAQKHGHELSAEAQRKLWLSQPGHCPSICSVVACMHPVSAQLAPAGFVLMNVGVKYYLPKQCAVYLPVFA